MAEASPGRPFPTRLITTEDLDLKEIRRLVDHARELRRRHEQGQELPCQAGKCVVLWFTEPSTRTRLAFASALTKLGASFIDLEPAASSMAKGESMVETARTLNALGMAGVVMRTGHPDGPRLVAEHFGGMVINAGAGSFAHPTQALADLAAVAEKREVWQGGLRMLVVGDIVRSRVARSTVRLWTRLGHQVTLAAPSGGLPQSWLKSPPALVEVTTSLPELGQFDLVMMLRTQREREGIPFPSPREFARHFGLTRGRAAMLKEDALILHPGPYEPGVEIDPEVARTERSLIQSQVEWGVWVRAALMDLMLSSPGGEEGETGG